MVTLGTTARQREGRGVGGGLICKGDKCYTCSACSTTPCLCVCVCVCVDQSEGGVCVFSLTSLMVLCVLTSLIVVCVCVDQSDGGGVCSV